MNTSKYRSVAALKAALKEAVDYRIVARDRASWVTIVSPHGGYIEPGTSAIAQAVAGRSYNLFDFQSLRETDAKELHVTSTRFREEKLVHLLKHSRAALSIHCMGTCHEQVVWLGGRNAALKQLVLAKLSDKFQVNPDSPKYRGESPENFVNMVCHQGVQLELSEELIFALIAGKPFAAKRSRKLTLLGRTFVAALRQALYEYRRSPEFSKHCA